MRAARARQNRRSWSYDRVHSVQGQDAGSADDVIDLIFVLPVVSDRRPCMQCPFAEDQTELGRVGKERIRGRLATAIVRSGFGLGQRRIALDDGRSLDRRGGEKERQARGGGVEEKKSGRAAAGKAGGGAPPPFKRSCPPFPPRRGPVSHSLAPSGPSSG